MLLNAGIISGFSPLSLSPLAWFDASDTSTITESGGAVTQWADKSGNANNANAGTSPVTGTRTVNGLNVIDFITNDYLEISATIGKPSSFTVAAVFQSDSASRQFACGSIDSSGATATTWGVIELDTNFETLYGNGSDFRRSTFDISASTSLYKVIATYSNGDSDTSLRVNEVGGSVTGTLGTATSCGGTAYKYSLGRAGEFNGVYFDGVICEVVLLDRVITSGEIAQLESYFSRWG